LRAREQKKIVKIKRLVSKFKDKKKSEPLRSTGTVKTRCKHLWESYVEPPKWNVKFKFFPLFSVNIKGLILKG
jgi:hypothetical protein